MPKSLGHVWFRSFPIHARPRRTPVVPAARATQVTHVHVARAMLRLVVFFGLLHGERCTQRWRGSVQCKEPAIELMQFQDTLASSEHPRGCGADYYPRTDRKLTGMRLRYRNEVTALHTTQGMTLAPYAPFRFAEGSRLRGSVPQGRSAPSCSFQMPAVSNPFNAAI